MNHDELIKTCETRIPDVISRLDIFPGTEAWIPPLGTMALVNQHAVCGGVDQNVRLRILFKETPQLRPLNSLRGRPEVNLPVLRKRNTRMQDLLSQQKAFELPVQVDTKREELILEHMPQIKYIAQRISTKLPSHVELNDLVSAGVLGLLDAIEKFDPNRGVKFKTYAELRIKGAILDSLRNLDWAPRSLRKKSKDLERVYRELEQRLGRPAADKEVCEEMEISLEEFYELVDQIKGLNLGSFQELSAQDEEKAGEPLVKYVPDAPQMDPFFVFHKTEIQGLLSTAIDTLPKKERLVVSLYYFDELTMKEIGKVLGVNESRVSQLHTKAMLRLRTKLRKVNGQD